ncbi:MAG: carboxymuconolactone decarboxylase family protein [Allomuricauda sp.]|jgi:alkylhydroperoxidase/carboxymuconolactone decarboxylase family protein YurZ
MSTLKTFQEEAPEVQQAYAGVIDSLIGLKNLDAKTKQLIFIAMKIVNDDENAVLHHVPMSKAAGATREEIKETVLLSLSVIGLKGISKYLDKCLNAFDN